jgi:hypothetical protein
MSLVKAMLASTEAERQMWADIEVCKFAASHHMFCKYSGRLLDTRTVVVVEILEGGKVASTIVAHGDVWDDRGPTVTAWALGKGYTVDVTDGRDLERSRKFYVAQERAVKRAAQVANLATVASADGVVIAQTRRVDLV